MGSVQKTILIVEDEKTLREALKVKLTHEGFSILEASDGREGLAQALGKHPDLILLDIILPVMDGVSMMNSLREDQWGKTVPIIVLTNLSDEMSFAQSVSNAVFDYLVKSDWRLEDVVKKIKQKLSV